MKKVFAILSAACAAIAASVSCSSELQQAEQFTPKTVKAQFVDSKTSLVDGKLVAWTSSDKISAFDYECVNHASTNTAVSAEGNVATFTIGSLSVKDDIFMALCPYDASATLNDSYVITTTLPLKQTAVAGSFAANANIAIAEGGVDNLYFMNCGGLLRVDVKNDNIVKIALTAATKYQNIAGPCYVSFDSDDLPLMQSASYVDNSTVTLEGEFENGKSYYFVVIPGTYTTPTIEFTDKDGKTASYTQKNNLTVERNDNLIIFDKEIPASKFEGSTDDDTTAQYALVTKLDDVTAGEYIITVNGYMLPNAAKDTGKNTAKKIADTDLTLANDVLSGDASAYSWNFAGTSASAMHITSTATSANALYATNDNNGITIGAANTGKTCNWAITVNNAANRTFYMKESVNSRYLALYSTTNFRSYTGTGSGNPAVKLYKNTRETIVDPKLEVTARDGSSVTVSWTHDSRATNGYNCSIYSGTTKLAKDQNGIKSGSVTFTGLTANTTYTVKVYAVAVAGQYNASQESSIEATTYVAQTVSSVTAAGSYYIKNLTVLAGNGNGMYVVADATGKMLLYEKGSTYAVGTTFDAEGPVVAYNGVWRFNVSAVSNVTTGGEPSHGTATEATESYMTAYVAAPVVEYVHFKTSVGSGNVITVGGKTVTSYTALASWSGKNIEAYGYFIGYNSSSSQVCFVATSIVENTKVPTLSISASTKTWKSDETNAFVVNVTAENGSWTVSPTTVTWATVTADVTAGTITVTPKGSNTSDADYTATLTVTHTEDATLTKTITLTQKKASTSPVGGSITLAMTSTSVSDSDTGTTVAATKGSGGTTPAYTSSELRLYASNQLTITSETTITKIELTYHKQGTKAYIASVSANTGTYTSGGTSDSAATLVTDTWTGSATSVVLTMGASGQRVLTEVKITF